MMFSHLFLASVSSIFRKFSISLLSWRFHSLVSFASKPPDDIKLFKLFAAFRLVASPRGLEQISQITLAREFS